jgi:eukaryotic-like serine/threonine-protein kinase
LNRFFPFHHDDRTVEGRVSPIERVLPAFFLSFGDGQSIVFWSAAGSGADKSLKRISVSGGAAVTICPADAPFGMSWGVDGIVFGQGSKGVMRVSPNGGQPERLVSVKDGEFAHGPQVLPGGQAVLFTLATGTGGDRWDKAQVVVQSLKSGERKTLVNGGSDARYVPTGHIVYALGGTVFALPFDLKRLAVAGGPVPIVEGVQRTTVPGGNSGAAQFSFSSTGSLVYLPGPTGVSSGGRALALADRKGDLNILKLPPGSYDHPRVSPDGKRVAFGTDDGKESTVWIYDLAGTTSMRRLTFGGKNRFPIWSADGQRIAFQSDREGDLGIFWQRADGIGAAERLTKPDQGTSHVPESWSHDSKRFLFELTKGSNVSLWAFSLEAKKATAFGGVQSGTPITAAFSPDGRWVAYHSNETGPDAIYVQPFPATGAKYQIPKNDPGQNDHHPVWSSDGKELFYIPAQGALAAVSVTTQPSFAFGNAVPVPRRFTTENSAMENERNYDLTPDGKIVGAVLESEQTQTGTPTAPEIRVVLNWSEELTQRVPTK